MWYWVCRGNIQQIDYIPQTEQHSPFGLMLLWVNAVLSEECNYYLQGGRNSVFYNHAKSNHSMSIQCVGVNPCITSEVDNLNTIIGCRCKSSS